mmetsp:Transcript_27574/g.86267  ORF Transcript_27574/g.86267 Transcript_27574/m.86267 type:complete len:310 (-) Transcript_27574:13-942(-)
MYWLYCVQRARTAAGPACSPPARSVLPPLECAECGAIALDRAQPVGAAGPAATAGTAAAAAWRSTRLGGLAPVRVEVCVEVARNDQRRPHATAGRRGALRALFDRAPLGRLGRLHRRHPLLHRELHLGDAGEPARRCAALLVGALLHHRLLVPQVPQRNCLPHVRRRHVQRVFVAVGGALRRAVGAPAVLHLLLDIPQHVGVHLARVRLRRERRVEPRATVARVAALFAAALLRRTALRPDVERDTLCALTLALQLAHHRQRVPWAAGRSRISVRVGLGLGRAALPDVGRPARLLEGGRWRSLVRHVHS